MFKHFTIEDGIVEHIECEEKGKFTEGKIIITAQVAFDLEGNSLRNPEVKKIDENTKIILKCNVCGFEEDITDQVKIVDERDKGYYGGLFISFKL
jgi:hypothetical protein